MSYALDPAGPTISWLGSRPLFSVVIQAAVTTR
jgi:hypothetical protein